MAESIIKNTQWITETRTSETVTVPANYFKATAINIAKTGYTPMGLLFVDTSDNYADVSKFSQYRDTAYVTVHNFSGSNISTTVTVKVLYKPD